MSLEAWPNETLPGMSSSAHRGLVFINVFKDPEKDEERGVYVRLEHGSFNKCFYLAGRNSAVEEGYSYSPYFSFPYRESETDAHAARYMAQGPLRVNISGSWHPILNHLGLRYILVPCNNAFHHGETYPQRLIS